MVIHLHLFLATLALPDWTVPLTDLNDGLVSDGYLISLLCYTVMSRGVWLRKLSAVVKCCSFKFLLDWSAVLLKLRTQLKQKVTGKTAGCGKTEVRFCWVEGRELHLAQVCYSAIKQSRGLCGTGLNPRYQCLSHIQYTVYPLPDNLQL